MERPQSYWEKRLPTAWGMAQEVPAEVDVAIVGGGFLGLWLAGYLCAGAPSLRVLVLERDLGARGASTKNAGFLTCGHVSEMVADARETSREAVLATFLARREGLELLLAEAEHVVAVEPTGSIDWDELDGEKRQTAERMNEVLRANGRAAAFEERDVVFAGRPRRAMTSVFDCAVDPVELLRFVHHRAETRGALVAHGAEVRSARGGQLDVKLAVGRSAVVRAGHTFLCTNAFSAPLHEQSRIVPGRGQVIVTSPVAPTTTASLGFRKNGYDYFRTVDGRLLFGGGRQAHRDTERTTSLDPTTDLLRYLVRAAAEVLGHDRFSVEHQWSGVMGFWSGKHLGGEPLRPIDAQTSALFACGGMGVALAPKVARDVARTYLGA